MTEGKFEEDGNVKFGRSLRHANIKKSKDQEDSSTSVENKFNSKLSPSDQIIAHSGAVVTENESKGGIVSSSSTQLTIGSGEQLLLSSSFKIADKSTKCTVSDGVNSATTKCMKVHTTAIPSNHDIGPWCLGGMWDHKFVDFTGL